MHIYTLTNAGTGPRLVYNVRSKPVPVDPKSSTSLELSDATATLIRRCEARGDALKISATTDEGEIVLRLADIPPVKRGFKMVGGAGDRRPPKKDLDELANVPPRVVEQDLQMVQDEVQENREPLPASKPTRVRLRSKG